MSATVSQMRYYNSGTFLGVVGTQLGHQDGDHTYLANHSSGERGPWVLTADLHATRKLAESAPPAKFYRAEQKSLEGQQRE